MQEQAALCYVPCKSGYSGVGPFCWEVCPSLYPADDGALCCDGLCSPKIADMAKAVLEAVVAALAAGEDPQLIINAVKAAIEAVLGFVLPICK